MRFTPPMPDELAVAHEGRLTLLNRCSSTADLFMEIEAELARRDDEGTSSPKLHQLARINGLDPLEYARCHSLLPATRVACSPGDEDLHGSTTSRQSRARIRRTAQAERAHCCIQCVAEDVQSWGFSWFRRTHHVIGFDWCPTHGTVLHEVDVDADHAFARLPHQWLSDEQTHPVPAVNPILPRPDEVIGRYVMIYLALLGRDRPIPAPRLNMAIATKAKALGLAVNSRANLPRLSDLVASTLPALWLDRHVRNWSQRSARRYFSRLDAMVNSLTVPCAGDAYVLAAAVLFSSVAEALASILGGGAGPHDVL